MDTDFRKTDLKISSDPRLRAGVRAALECICERHGLPKGEQHDLAAAVEKECGDELGHAEESGCAVTINESDEKIEVSVAPAAHTNGARSTASETNVASSAVTGKHFHGGSVHEKANGGAGATFVKRFHKDPARS